MRDGLHIAIAGAGEERTELLHAGLASYSGHLRHGSAWHEWNALWDHYPWLSHLFTRCGGTIRLRWPTRPVRGPRFSGQYGRLIRGADERTLVFCQIGRFVEFLGPQRDHATRALCLVRVNRARAGYAYSVGFPSRLRGEYVSRALRAGYVVADVREGGRLDPRCAERRVVVLCLAASEAPAERVAPGSGTG